MTNRKCLGGSLAYGIETMTEVRYKVADRYRVVNFTHRYFAIGASTSGRGTIGFLVSAKAAKRGSTVEGETHTAFRGILAQAVLGYFKVYLYIFFRGDGLGE